jgi:hypothetical protein
MVTRKCNPSLGTGFNPIVNPSCKFAMEFYCRSASRTNSRDQSSQCQLCAVAFKKQTIIRHHAAHYRCSTRASRRVPLVPEEESTFADLASITSCVDERNTSESIGGCTSTHHTCGLMHKAQTNIKCCKMVSCRWPHLLKYEYLESKCTFRTNTLSPFAPRRINEINLPYRPRSRRGTTSTPRPGIYYRR